MANKAENILEVLRTDLGNLVDSVTLINASEMEYNYSVEKNGIKIDVYYTVATDVYGFKMLQGGVKQYSEFNQFVGMFKIYVYLNTVFIPKAKTVADMYEKTLGVNTVYQTFSGNVTDGFVAIFKVLGRAERVEVKEYKGYFTASFISPDDNGGEEVVSTYKYILHEDGTFTEALTIDVYIDQLYAKFGESDDFEIARTSDLGFSVEVDDLKYDYVVEIDEESDKIKYIVTKVNDTFVDNFEVVLDDYMDLAGLHEVVKNKNVEILSQKDRDTLVGTPFVIGGSSVPMSEPVVEDSSATEDMLFDQDISVLSAGQESIEEPVELSEEQKTTYADMKAKEEELTAEAEQSASNVSETEKEVVEAVEEVPEVTEQVEESKPEAVEDTETVEEVVVEEANKENETPEKENETAEIVNETVGISNVSTENNTEVSETEEKSTETAEESVETEKEAVETEKEAVEIEKEVVESVDNSEEINDKATDVEVTEKEEEVQMADNTENKIDVGAEEANAFDNSVAEAEVATEKENDVAEEAAGKACIPEEAVEKEQIVEELDENADETITDAIKLVDDNDALLGIVINTNHGIYIINEVALKKYKFPFARLVKKEKLVESMGMMITESEKRRGIFAVDVTEDETTVARLMKLMF